MEKTGVGSFEMVDHMEAVPTEEEVAKQSQVVLKQAQKMMNVQPILNLLEKMISQSRVIDTVIPSEVKGFARSYENAIRYESCYSRTAY
jgi:hypothetical protein